MDGHGAHLSGRRRRPPAEIHRRTGRSIILLGPRRRSPLSACSSVRPSPSSRSVDAAPTRALGCLRAEARSGSEGRRLLKSERLKVYDSASKYCQGCLPPKSESPAAICFRFICDFQSQMINWAPHTAEAITGPSPPPSHGSYPSPLWRRW